jgi:hypothetical protein
MRVTTTWTNRNPDTIWNRLAARLGREPTNAEAANEVRRILLEARVTLAEQGRLPHQRKR